MGTLTIRTDSTIDRALENLQEWTQQSRTDITKHALLAAERAMRRQRLRMESAALADDAHDRAEALLVAEEMAEINAW